MSRRLARLPQRADLLSILALSETHGMRGLYRRKQEWVWAFADALIARTEVPMDHMHALDVGYEYWEALHCGEFADLEWKETTTPRALSSV